MGRTTSIIEFGTSKIVCMSGTILKDETAEVHSVARVPYPGIKNGNWVDAKAVLPALEKAVIQIEQEMRRNIRQVFVGVPGCYTEIALETKEIFIDDGKVQNRHIDELLASEPPDTGKEFEVIDSRPVYFIDSRENIYVQPPVDISTEKLTVQMAFTGAFRPFLEDIEHLLADLKIQVVDFLPEKLAQA